MTQSEYITEYGVYLEERRAINWGPGALPPDIEARCRREAAEHIEALKILYGVTTEPLKG